MQILFLFVFLLSISNIFLIYGFSEEQGSITTVENTNVQKINPTVSEETVSEETSYGKSELDKLFETMRKNEEKQWRQGDVLIASATTLAFFGFASFLTAQFRGKNSDIENRH